MFFVNTLVKPIKSYFVWEDFELQQTLCIEVSAVTRNFLESITLEGCCYAEVKAINEDEAKEIFAKHYNVLEMYKLKDSQAYVLRKSYVTVESRFYC